jgi:molybdenum cofactor cytidylyltransferase
MSKKAAGLILAAGLSSRMGELKALLHFGEDTLIERQVKSFIRADINEVFVVCGYRADEIKAAVKDYPVHVVLNENYIQGMLSSVKKGLEAVNRGSYDCIILLPVDYPLIQPYTIEMLASKFSASRASIVYPSYNYKKGHPILISTELIDAILAYDGEGGLKSVLKDYEKEAEYVDVGNASVLIDIDTRQDYARALDYMNNLIMPNLDECRIIFSNHNVSKQVIEHGKTVGEVARAIAQGLVKKNYEVDPDLLHICGLLHDFMKGHKNHDKTAARILVNMGYKKIASVVENHMSIQEDYKNRICNESVLYYADKIVKGTAVVTINNRISNINEPDKLPFAAKRIKDAKKIQDMLEQALDIKLPQGLNALKWSCSDEKESDLSYTALSD